MRDRAEGFTHEVPAQDSTGVYSRSVSNFIERRPAVQILARGPTMLRNLSRIFRSKVGVHAERRNVSVPLQVSTASLFTERALIVARDDCLVKREECTNPI